MQVTYYTIPYAVGPQNVILPADNINGVHSIYASDVDGVNGLDVLAGGNFNGGGASRVVDGIQTH